LVKLLFEKLVFNTSDKPKLIEALIFTISCSPDKFRCSPRFIR